MLRAEEGGGASAHRELVVAIQAARAALSTGHSRTALLMFLKLVAAAPGLGEMLEQEIIASLLGSVENADSSSAAFLFRGAERALPQSAPLAVAEGGGVNTGHYPRNTDPGFHFVAAALATASAVRRPSRAAAALPSFASSR
jgi:hypothetical protein